MKYQRVCLDRIGYELAPLVVTSAEIEERLAPLYETLRMQPGQLEQMTGITERRFWEPGFAVSKGAIAAALQALADSVVPADAIEMLIFAGVCREGFEPATACHVAAGLAEQGQKIRPTAAVYDISNACLGVLNGMMEIANRIELGQLRAGMVVSCESAREIVEIMIERLLRERDMESFKTGLATMTGGSAAVAIILTDGTFGAGRQPRLRGGVTMTDPQHHHLCRWGMEELHRPRLAEHGEVTYRQTMSTDSVAVLEHGVALARQTWKGFLEEMGWSGVDRTVCHQVGSAHRSTVLDALGLPPEHDFVAYDYLGNTGTVALPLAAALAAEREYLQPGHRVGLLGIGSGLNCMMLGAEW